MITHPFTIGKYTLHHSEANVALSKMVSRYCHSNDNSALKTRDPDDSFCRCEDGVSKFSESIMFAVIDTAENQFYGVFGIYDASFIEDEFGLTAAGKCTPHLPNVGSETWCEEIAMFMKWFLENDVAFEDGTSLDIVEWQFDLVNPQYRWDTTYCAKIIDNLDGVAQFTQDDCMASLCL